MVHCRWLVMPKMLKIYRKVSLSGRYITLNCRLMTAALALLMRAVGFLGSSCSTCEHLQAAGCQETPIRGPTEVVYGSINRQAQLLCSASIVWQNWRYHSSYRWRKTIPQDDCAVFLLAKERCRKVEQHWYLESQKRKNPQHEGSK
jgi:hypothetical protein